MLKKFNIIDEFDLVKEFWSPKIISELNGQCVKIAKLKGEFVWHNHEKEDELFYVIKGQLKIELKGRTIILNPGEMFTVPAGVDHRPVADEEVHVILFEPKTTVNKGSADTNCIK